MKLQTTKVLYSIKDERGFILDKTKTFNTHKEAMEYIIYLNTQNLIGKPVLEVK